MNLNILIIEDELIIYVHLEKTLRQLGFTTIYKARTAKDALNVAATHHIDLLFSDIQIEGDMDGIDTARTLQNLYGLPVIFITAYKDQETLQRASSVDFLGYLLKPYRVDELDTLIKLAISKYSLRTSKSQNIPFGEYIYDKTCHKLYHNNNEVELTKKEQLFIMLMCQSKGSIISYQVLDDTLWQGEIVKENTRRTFLYRLKSKLNDFPFLIEKNIGIRVI